jgi:hypothetical protein
VFLRAFKFEPRGTKMRLSALPSEAIIGPSADRQFPELFEREGGRNDFIESEAL